MITLDDLKRELFLKRPAVHAGYDVLADEFLMIRAKASLAAGAVKTQAHQRKSETEKAD